MIRPRRASDHAPGRHHVPAFLACTVPFLMGTVSGDTNRRVHIMARRSRKSSSRPKGRRVNNISLTPNANRRLHPLPPRLVSPVAFDLRPYDDRRLFHPAPFTRPAVSLGRRADTKLSIPSNPLRSVQRLNAQLSHQIGFDKPRKVLICVRRAIRKEVMHAMGKGGSKVRKPRRNQFSDVRC